MNKYIAFLVIAILLFSGFACKKTGQSADSKKPVPPQKVKVARGPLKLTVASTGRVVSNLDVEIKCKASGEIIGLPFDISDPVKKGELVMELDPVDENRNVQKSQVAVDASQSRLEKSKIDLDIAQTNVKSARKKAEVAVDIARARAKDERAKTDRVKQLFDKKLAGQEEYDTAETSAQNAESDLRNALIALDNIKTQEDGLELNKKDILLAKTDLESAKINLSIAEQRLVDTKVFSPIDGVVTERLVQIGQIISSGISTTGGGTKVMTISDLSRMFVYASVDESDIGTVATGQDVDITADAFPDVKFKGKVERIAQKGVNESNVVTFEVRIEVLSDNKTMLRPEMTANVDIIAASKDNVLYVPVGAVSRAKGKQFVDVLKDDGTEEKREVETGINDGENIEITSGLKEGETVLVKLSGSDSQWRRGGQGNNRPPVPMGMMGGGH